MFVYPTDEFEVSEILKNMKNEKNTGEDGISNVKVLLSHNRTSNRTAKVIPL